MRTQPNFNCWPVNHMCKFECANHAKPSYNPGAFSQVGPDQRKVSSTLVSILATSVALLKYAAVKNVQKHSPLHQFERPRNPKFSGIETRLKACAHGSPQLHREWTSPDQIQWGNLPASQNRSPESQRLTFKFSSQTPWNLTSITCDMYIYMLFKM